MTDTAELAQFFKALSDETRLRLITLLAQQTPGSAMCVSRLARELSTTTPNVSQHLRVLKDLGLLRGERRRHRIHYYLDAEQLTHYITLTRAVLGETFVIGEERA